MHRNTKSSDEKIIETLEEHKALTQLEIEDSLKYSHGSLRKRLHRLLVWDKIKAIQLLDQCIIFGKYNKVTMYYVNDEDFFRWIAEKIPRNLSRSAQRIITLKLHQMGIDIIFYHEQN